jgi:hypothetical protein
MLMEFFEILDKIMYSLRVEELIESMMVLTYSGGDLATFRMTCEGSVLSMAFKYCCMAPS